MNAFLNVSQPWTQTELETRLRSLQEQLADGQRIISTSAGDTSVAMERVASLETSIERIYRQLFQLDPAHYPIDQIVRVDRTRVIFGDISAANVPGPGPLDRNGTQVLESGATGGTVTGLALGAIPRSVLLTVQGPLGGLTLAASVTGTPSADGFTFALTGATDSADYTLYYHITL